VTFGRVDLQEIQMPGTTHARRIDGRARTVRELLDGARYTIDFYQREYAWEKRQVCELIDDLTGKFMDDYRDDHERHKVETYGHYFLGSVVISNKNQQKFIVDGQQRLTTLTLLLIHLHHLAQDKPELEVDSVETLVFSKKFGRRSFNLDVEDRAACMEKLFNREPFDAAGSSESVKNIVSRFQDICERFPDDVAGRALPYFVDWLRESVHLVEIEAYSDEDAYTIFETMNDRGLSLSLPEMLKGYVLANIEHEPKQRVVNDLWKKYIQALKDLGKEEEVDFFKNWLRARYAESVQHGNGAENKDYERIGSEFHRWVRDQKERLGLTGSNSFVRFVEKDFDFYAKQTLTIRKAAQQLTPGLEAIYFNDQRGFTTQTQVLLAAVSPDDPPDEIRRKLALVADYLDIWLTRQTWAYRSTAQRNVKYSMFNLTKAIRGMSAPALSAFLRQRLDEDRETFARHPDLGVHQQNFYAVRHILARITYWVDAQCGVASHFEDYASGAKNRPFEVEHIWPNQFERFREWFGHESEFDRARNRIGGLVLLQRGPNQSLGGKPFEEKRDVYVAQGQSLLTRSLHPLAYKNNPAFTGFIERTGLEFRPHEIFNTAAQQQRQTLYLRIAEWVWNPSRLDLDGIKPPVHEPLIEPDEEEVAAVDKGIRFEKRKAFWTKLVQRSKEQGGLHGRLTPSGYSWLGVRESGFWWNFAVVQQATRVELAISTWEIARNKAVYDRLCAEREAIEAEFGGKLDWQRLDDNITSKIAVTVPGGWVDESTFDLTVATAVSTMKRFYNSLEKRAKAAKDATE
jgi:uncharacterized protein with ParB-like and HNH nuclease domain